jgi:membrane protease YdiL (CAAX protease family)
MLARVTTLVWNGDTERLRLPWRLLVWLVLLVALGFLAQLLIVLVRSPSAEPLLVLVTPGLSPDRALIAVLNVVFLVLQLVVMVGSVYVAGRYLDRRSFRDFGFRLDREWWLNLGFGLALGAALMTGVFLFELLVGWVTVRDLFFVARAESPFWPWFLWGLVSFVAVGIYEELLFRGYLITNLAEGLTWFEQIGRATAVTLAVLVTSLFFGVAHAGNPNATLASTAGIVVAALVLAGGYVLTGELAVPIGIHITWNFFQGPVYGFPVSGTNGGVALVAIEQSGPTVLTGGNFGPEAGVIGLLAAGIGLVLVALWVQWRDGRLRFPPELTTPERR